MKRKRPEKREQMKDEGLRGEEDDTSSDDSSSDTDSSDSDTDGTSSSTSLETNKLLSSDDDSQEILYSDCRWSPDGICFLSASTDNKVKVFEMRPSDGVTAPDMFSSSLTTDPHCNRIPWTHQARLTLEVPCWGSVYDIAWNPGMNYSDPQSYFFATACKGCPVQIRSAYYGNELVRKRVQYLLMILSIYLALIMPHSPPTSCICGLCL